MLSECSGVYGHAEVFDSAPSLLELKNAIFIPIGDPTGWGVFDVGRRIVPSSCYFRGPEPAFAGSVTPYMPNSIQEMIYGKCWYVGYLNEHFGHFLLSTFSRLWPLRDTQVVSGLRLACHVSGSVDDFFNKRPWAVEMISALGLKTGAFFSPSQPTRFQNLTIPAPSFEESHYAHVVFADLCHQVGAQITRNVPDKKITRPAYLSKEKLVKGVRKIANERDAIGLLAKYGVEIVYPETMSMVEQAVFWRDRECVASFVGSGLHASILSPGRRIIACSDSAVINSSFVLIDKINGTKSRYLAMPEGGMIGHTKTDDFAEISYILDPKAYAEHIIEAIEGA